VENETITSVVLAVVGCREKATMSDERLLTIREVATHLRCSKAHVCNLILGRVRGAQPLAVITLGRRKLIRHSTLMAWMKANEHTLGGGMLPSSLDVEAVGRE